MNNTRKNTIKIGSFTEDAEGFEGKLFGFGFGVTDAWLEPQMTKEGKKFFRLLAGIGQDLFEIGAGFPRTKGDVAYHSVSIDSPMLPSSINAALFRDKEGNKYNLIWSRREAESDLNAETPVKANPQSPDNADVEVKRSVRSRPTL